MSSEALKSKKESLLPVGKDVEELFLSPHEELEAYATKAGVSVEKLLELLLKAKEQKDMTMEAALAKKEKVPVGVDERAESIRQEILKVLAELDFFQLNKIPGNSEELETTAFAYLDRVDRERDEQQQKALSAQAEGFFRESQKAWASMRASDLMREGKSQKEALSLVAEEMRSRLKNDNVRERVEATREVMRQVASRSYSTEMYDMLEKVRQGYESGSPSEADKEYMRKLMNAARGTYLRGAYDAHIFSAYGLQNVYSIARQLGRAYGKAAGFDLSQNQGALGSIEKFDIDLPNSYNTDGSPRSRPRRSSIPEERY